MLGYQLAVMFCRTSAVEYVLAAKSVSSMNQATTPSHIAEELVATVRKAESVLRTLNDETVSIRPEADRWTIKEVLGHLIDSAANNHQRFVRAQFTTQLVFPKYEQNEWVHSQNYNAAAWQELIDLWSIYNRHLAHVIRNIAASALTAKCTIGDYDTVTLHFLLTDYVVHLRHHMRKIAQRVNMDDEAFGC